jgi:hypothetical protein
MQIKRRVFLMGNLVLALSLMGSATQKQEVGGDPEIPTAKLVTTMRLLTTEQMNYRDQNHRFASHDEFALANALPRQVSPRPRKPCALSSSNHH